MSRPIRVLILTQYFPPETGAAQARLFELGSRLVEQDFEVDVLTALPNYPQGRIYDGYRGKLYAIEQDAGMHVVHVPVFPSRSPRLIPRMLSYFSFVFSSVIFGLFLARRPRVLICESPPLFLGLSALVLKIVFGCRLIFNVSDLWPESAVRMGMHNRKPFVWLAERLEAICYRGSDAQTGQSPGIVRGIRAKHPRGRVELISNGCDCELFRPDRRNRELRRRWGVDDKVVVGYAGLIGIAQGVGVIGEVAEQFRGDERVAFVIAGDGPEREQLQQQLASRELSNVTFTGWLPKSEMPATVASFDTAFIPLRYFIPGALPSKVYESMASQVPVVLAAEGDPKELIERADAGIVVDYDADEIAAAIRRLADDPDQRRRLGDNGRRYVLEHHQRDVIAGKLGDLIESLAHGGRAKQCRAASNSSMDVIQVTRLFREARLRRVSDMAYRLYHGTMSRLGMLRRRFPAVTADEADFVRALKPGGPNTMREFVEHFDSRHEPLFYFDHRDPVSFPAIGKNGGTAPQALLDSGDQIVQRRFSVLGSREVQFNGHVDWLHCLNGDARWPADRHWSQVDFRHAHQQGDVKTCWEWNRHQQFVTLGRLYRRTGDERYVDEFVRLLNWWCEQNPPEMGVHYASNLEVGLRCVSWLWAHHLMAPSECYPHASRGRLHLFLYYMARHLAANLNYTAYTGRNNHLIGDASCLAVWCLMYPELRESDAWLERSLALLWEALEEQVYSDGVHFELSFGYHQFVLELALQVVLLLRRSGRSIPTGVAARLEKMTEVFTAVVQPDGEPPNFNDNDDGVVWALHDSPRERLKSLLEIGAELFDRPDFVCGSDFEPTEQAALLLGRSPPKRDSTEVDDATPGVTRFEHAGLYVMRSGAGDASQFAMINNHPDPFPNSGHNHASLLQLLLWIDGKPLLIDGGTYRYSDDDGYRNALRGTHAHNTVVVDGQDQAEPSRNFGWLSKLRPGESRIQDTDEIVVFDGYHDSYRRLRNPVRHRRRVVWIRQPNIWIVRDDLSGTGTHTYRQLWHLPADYQVSQVTQGWIHVDRGDDFGVGVQLLTDPDDRIEIVCGDRQRLWSWESPRYGVLRPRRSIVLEWTAPGPTSRVTAFFPMRQLADDERPVVQTGTNRLSIFNGIFELEFEEDSVRCERKESPCKTTFCPSAGR